MARAVVVATAVAGLSLTTGCATSPASGPGSHEPPVSIQSNDTLFLSEVYGPTGNVDAVEQLRMLTLGHTVCGIVWSFDGGEAAALRELERRGVGLEQRELIVRAAVRNLCRDGPIWNRP